MRLQAVDKRSTEGNFEQRYDLGWGKSGHCSCCQRAGMVLVGGAPRAGVYLGEARLRVLLELAGAGSCGQGGGALQAQLEVVLLQLRRGAGVQEAHVCRSTTGWG